MKYLILFSLLFSVNTLACQNQLPESEVIKAINLEPNAGSKSCADLPGERCLCYDGIDWHSAELTDNLVLDFIRKEKTDSCASEDECKAKEAALICDLGKPIRTENEVYCAVEAYKKDGKKLVNSPEKKAAREAAEKAQEEAKKVKEDIKAAAKERVKALDLSKTLTTKQLTDALKDVQIIIKD